MTRARALATGVLHGERKPSVTTVAANNRLGGRGRSAAPPRNDCLAGCGKKGFCALSRLRKKAFSATCSRTLVSPRGRELKESSHPFGSAQDKLLCRVRNARVCLRPKYPFFSTLLISRCLPQTFVKFVDSYQQPPRTLPVLHE